MNCQDVNSGQSDVSPPHPCAFLCPQSKIHTPELFLVDCCLVFVAVSCGSFLFLTML
jgi:hypothetical protein